MAQESLMKHINSIIPLIFNHDSEDITIRVYDPEEASSQLKYISVPLHSFDFLVTIRLKSQVHFLDDKIKRLGNLLSKEIYSSSEEGTVQIYWFEGTQAGMTQDDKLNVTDNQPVINKLKSETRFPAWLDNYIFDILNAKYEPNYEKFDYNLEHLKEDLLIYLGTYFPRSYAESFCIFDDLFANDIIKSNFKLKDELNVLDIGCGTGGNLIGLLTAINKYFHSNFVINIWAIDGNIEALELLKQIIDQFSLHSEITVKVTYLHKKFSKITELRGIVQELPCQLFDIIMSFKTVCEIIAKGNGLLNNSYYEIAQLACNLLSRDGLFLLLDITTKTPFTNFLPIHLNEQTRCFVINDNDYKIFVPLSCYFFSFECQSQCFYQYEFFISHRQKNNDVSRVAYKILGRKGFIEEICSNMKTSNFIINWKYFAKVMDHNGCCQYSTNKVEYSDAFKVNQA